MRYTPSIVLSMIVGSMIFANPSHAAESKLASKGLHDCEHAAYGQAEMFVSSEEELDGNNHSFTLLPNYTAVDDMYVPFVQAGIKERVDFDGKKHVFKIKHTGYYNIGYYFKCSGPVEEAVLETLNIGIRIIDKNDNEKQVYAFHKVGLSGANALLRQVFEVSDHCIAKLHKGDKVGLFIFQLPFSQAPLVYANAGAPSFVPDTAASLSIWKAETD